MNIQGTTDQAQRIRNLIELNVAVLLFGGTSLFAKLIDLPVPYIIFGRSAVAACFLVILCLVAKIPMRPASGRDLAVLSALGVALALHWLTYFQAIRVSTVAVGIISLHTYPVITVLLEPLVDRTRIKAFDALLAVAVVIGIIILVPEFSLASEVSRGVLWGIASAFLFTIRNLAVRRYVQRYSGPTMMLYQTAVTALVLVPVVVASRGLGQTVAEWKQFLILGTIFTAVAQSLYAASLKHLSAKTVAIVATLLPLYGAVLAWLILGEIPTLRTVIGGLVIIGAVVVETVRAAARREKPHASEARIGDGLADPAADGSGDAGDEGSPQ